MSLIFDQKEDLQMRMADLQQKLAESEEERRKLEKTCNIFIRAFKEEEKMHYKALNNKYEKFLEDCKLRRRRNDIILRSLCRVEDRARALFASSERLKALKDHYITYLRPNDHKNTETFLLTWKTYLPTSKAAAGVISKSVHWKTPHVADLNHKTGGVSKTEETKAIRKERLEKDLPPNFESDYPSLYKSLTERYYQCSPTTNTIGNQDPVQDSPEIVKEEKQRESILSKIFHKEQPTRPVPPQDKLNSDKISLLNSEYFKKSPTDLTSTQINIYGEVSNNYEHSKKSSTKLTSRQFSTFEEGSNIYNRYGTNTDHKYVGDCSKKKLNRNDVLENSVNSDLEMEFNDLKKVTALREKGVVKHQESIEKLKTALSLEDNAENEGKNNEKSFLEEISPYRSNQKIIEKDEIEMNEKSNGSEVSTFPKIDKENMNHQYAITSRSKTNLMFTSFADRDEPENKEIEFVKSEKEIGSEKNEERDQKNEFSAPLSLDGVDYQNETYPESYYEQPVHHHNYSNIVSNVILEEDESEQEADCPEVPDEVAKHLFISQNGTFGKTLAQEHMLEGDNTHQSSFSSSQSPSRSFVYDKPYADEKPQESVTDKRLNKENRDHALYENQYDQFKDRDFGCKKSVEVEKHGMNMTGGTPRESKADDSLKNLKQIAQSNLAHLLDSDSESFQIEHGDSNSGNEDSDFDFSFHQN